MEDVLPEFLNQCNLKDGWLIGDGSKIYVCDFFLGTLYTDIFNNCYSWISPIEKQTFYSQFPKFEEYGKRFSDLNRSWLDKREKATGKYKF